MKNFWDERYSEKEFVYGKEANVFLSEQLKLLHPGKIILPCEGEGRNAVFAAKLAWDVVAFDLSEVGKNKALQWALENKVHINYVIENANLAHFNENSADVVAFIYAHFPADIRKSIHQKAIDWLKPGGKIILEAFNPLQLNNLSGGPKELSMLYTTEILLEDFKNLEIEILENKRVELNEGNYHKGWADIIRFTAIKK